MNRTDSDAAAKPAPKTFEDLVKLMDRLRDPGGCPWDREQTLATIKTYLLEEAYELVEAIDADDGPAVIEELGDTAFEVVFLARLARERGWGDVFDSISLVHEKLVRRHPHVFGDAQIQNAGQVVDQWQKIKKGERKADGRKRSTLDGVPKSLPALLQATRISERAVARGFEWPDTAGVIDKLIEEVGELKEAVAGGLSKEKAEGELGDVLFTLVNVARKLGLDPHAGLMRTLTKFRRRFADMEAALEAENREMESCSIGELDALWERAKSREE